MSPDLPHPAHSSSAPTSTENSTTLRTMLPSARDVAVSAMPSATPACGRSVMPRYFCTVGSLKQLDHIKRMVLALPKSATCLVLQTSPGDVRAIKHFTDFTLATVGSLDDLPLIMEVLA